MARVLGVLQCPGLGTRESALFCLPTFFSFRCARCLSVVCARCLFVVFVACLRGLGLGLVRAVRLSSPVTNLR